MIARQIFRVLYSPVKAFEEIVEEPKFRGPLLILALTLLATTGSVYVNSSKFFLETPVLGSTLIPGSAPHEITLDFTIPDTARKISVFTFNWTSGSDIVTVYGENATGHSYAEEVTITSNHMAHNTSEAFTIVNKVAFSRAGDNSSQYVMLGMIPEEYACATERMPGLLALNLMPAAFSFLIKWIAYTGLIWAALKVLREEVGPFGTLLIIMGHICIVSVVNALAYTLLFSALPTVNLPLVVWGLPQQATEEARIMASDLVKQIYQEAGVYSNWAYQIGPYFNYIFFIWTAALCAVAVRSTFEFSWTKAVAISTFASIVLFFLRILLGL